MSTPKRDRTGVSVRQFFLGLVAIFALLAGAGFVLFQAVDAFSDLEPEVATPVVAAVVTVTVSVFSIVWQRRVERLQRLEEEHREQKVPIYEEFMGLWFRVLFSDKMGEPKPTEHELLKFFKEFTEKLMTWGSDAVIREYSTFRQMAVDPDAEPGIGQMLQFEKVLFAIRRDLGHKNRELAEGDLLALFVNDIRDQLAGAR